MSYLQTVVLGLIQGVTEFLPVSSSAHLAILPWMLRWPDQGLAYDVALHWGTLLALIVYFWKDWKRLLSAGVRGKNSEDRRLLIGHATPPHGHGVHAHVGALALQAERP